MSNTLELPPGAASASAPALHAFQEGSEATLRIAVGVATRGRAEMLLEMLAGLRSQTLKPAAVLVAYSQPGDVGQAPNLFPEVTFLLSEPGLTRQRNTVLQALPPADAVVFFDDDFCLREDFLDRMQMAFATHPEVVVITGHVVADGINGPGFTMQQARAILDRCDLPSAAARQKATLLPVFNAYGCNMGLRLDPIRAHRLRFDEELPLYGWYEDVEFSRQMARFGEIVKLPGALGVHLGVKGGRQSGLRLGYSQVANPVYLARRQRVSWMYAIASMLSRSLKNLVRSAWPEPFVDRRGRLKGNVQAWWDLARGTIHPQRAAQL